MIQQYLNCAVSVYVSQATVLADALSAAFGHLDPIKAALLAPVASLAVMVLGTVARLRSMP